MQCPFCNVNVSDEAKFCMECGTPLVDQARSGTALYSERGERKSVTVLFSDLSGYTALTERLDPEDVSEITRKIFDGVRRVIGKYEGSIDRYTGDGVLAVFGVPRAHEDDPIRAIRAAREIHAIVDELSRRCETEIGRSLAMHSGINTGLAVVAEIDPDGGTHGLTGDAINVGARICDLARPGEILVGFDTFHRAKGFFVYDALKPTPVKGKADPVLTYKVIAETPDRPEPESGREIYAEMVGRDSEMSKLESLLNRAARGKGAVVNVVGEAGIGKSRLITELKKRELMQDFNLLECRAISIGRSMSFHPLVDLLKQWAGIVENDAPPQVVEKLENAVKAVYREEAHEALPFIATLMGMKLRDKDEELLAGIEGESLEKLIAKNIRELFAKACQIGPMVVVMEDLHWADSSSLRLLKSLYRLTEQWPIVFINLFRPGYWEAEDRELGAPFDKPDANHIEIAIRPLDKQLSETLIGAMLDLKNLPFSLSEQILDRAGGNPFFIEEIVRSLIDQGAIVKGNNVLQVNDRIDTVVIPPTINSLLVARIDRLDVWTRELVKIASVIGRSFFDRILKDVAAFIQDIDSKLACLKDLQLIRDRIRIGELEHLFKHVLTQEAAYEATLRSQRRTLHVRVAQSIEKIFWDRLYEFYGVLAYHYSRGEDWEKAQGYMVRAGEVALRSSASTEALRYYQEGMRLYLASSADSLDTEKLSMFEKNIALACYNRCQWATSLRYIDRVLERWGESPRRKDGIGYVRFLFDFMTVIMSLYFRFGRVSRVPDSRQNEVFDLYYKRCASLGYVDNTLQFMASIQLIAKSSRFDIAKIANGSRLLLGIGGSVFTCWGILSTEQEIPRSSEEDPFDK